MEQVLEAIALASIRIDGGTQPRASVDMMYVAELAQAIEDGTTLPAIITFYDGTDYWLADGFHRYHASQQLDKETIDAEVRQGTRRDAIWFALGANKTHGLRTSTADKQRAIKTALNDPEWKLKSDREIGNHCGVDHKTVGAMRQNLTGEFPQSPIRIGADGRTYNTVNIGRAQQQEFIPLATTFDTQKPLPDLTEENRYFNAIDTGTTDLYYDNLRRDVIQRDQEREKGGENTSATLTRNEHVMQVMGSSESPEWYTPQEMVHLVLECLGEIDLDPCSNSHEFPNVPAHQLYTKEDNGLDKPWYGRVYLNPPYGSEIPAWIQKLVHEYEEAKTIEEAITLIPGRIDTQWFQPLYAYLMCHIRGRLQFENAQNSAPFPSILVYLGKQPDKFIATFKPIGPIMKRIG